MAGTRLVALWGDEHPDLDRVADARLDELSAVALTRGRFPKPYPHLDPNEDAVLAASGPAGRLLAVADGHAGFDAARAALRAVAAGAPGLLDDPVERPAAALEELCRAARAAVADVVAGADHVRAGSRTALTIALLVDGHVHVATYGDTVCLRARGGRGRAVGAEGPFLAAGADIPDVARARVGSRDRLLVASDGLSNYLGRDWPDRAATLLHASDDPVEAVRNLVELAMAGGAGDNVAVGVLL